MTVSGTSCVPIHQRLGHTVNPFIEILDLPLEDKLEMVMWAWLARVAEPVELRVELQLHDV